MQEHWHEEPVLRLRNYLAGLGAWDKDREEALARECSEAVNAAVETYLGTAPPGTDAMFAHLYATLPSALQAQRAEALRFAPAQGGDHG